MVAWHNLLELKRQLSHAPATARILPASRKALFAALGKVGIKDRDDYIAFYNLIAGRQVDSTNDLTDAEARIIADFLREQGETIMGENAEPTARTWTEAPASVNIKCNIEGFDVMLTLRGESGSEVIPVLLTALRFLMDNGARPSGNGRRGNGKPVANQQPASQQSAPVMGDGQPDPAYCPIHGVVMKRREKDGQVWHSHKVGDSWCRGKEA